MQFNSLSFICVFLPCVLAGYLLLRRTPFANLFMLLASLYFYGISAWWYLIPFFVTALLDFFVGQQIEQSSDPYYRKRMLILSVTANLGLLSVFKYTGWLTSDLSVALAPFGIALTPIALSLPPAISFYTFQSMSYTIDIYRREFKPYRNVVDYLSFVFVLSASGRGTNHAGSRSAAATRTDPASAVCGDREQRTIYDPLRSFPKNRAC
jgi:alginate O-acetyltransferase complex protein AlgI